VNRVYVATLSTPATSSQNFGRNESESLLVDFGNGFWCECRKLSGKRVDVLRGQNIPHNSRSIDRTLVPNGVVSHKSTDLRLKSYRSPRTVYRLGMRFVREVREYSGEIRCDHKKKATYHLHWAIEAPDAARILEWFIPASGISDEQECSLKQVIDEAKTAGVIVKLFRVCD
jgi:hypothetical protein